MSAEPAKAPALLKVPRGGFPCVLADPPWSFRDVGTRMAPSYAGDQREQARYRVMPLEDIRALGMAVRNWAAVDAFLFLWAPNALVIDGTASKVARSWDFEPKQLITWVKLDAKGKPRIGGGHYTRACTEQLLLCRRGRPKVLSRSVPGVVLAARGAHSAKPDASYEMIERLCGGPRLEMFARRKFGPEWTVWGDQAPGSDPAVDSSEGTGSAAGRKNPGYAGFRRAFKL